MLAFSEEKTARSNNVALPQRQVYAKAWHEVHTSWGECTCMYDVWIQPQEVPIS